MADPVLEPKVPEPQTAPLIATWQSGIAWGAAATVPAMVIFVISGGLIGHGDYVVARLIFPIPMLLVAMAPESIEGLMALSYLIQFPIYGALLGMRTRWSLGIFAVLAVLHVFAAIASFTELAFLF